MIRCGWQWYVWSATNKRCENVWFQASQKPSVQDLETDEWFRNVAKLQFWLAGACWILDPVATLPFLMWHHQLGSRTGRAVTWYVANQMYYIKAPITRNGDWVLERFRHVATHGLIVLLQPGVRSTLALQHQSLLRRDTLTLARRPDGRWPDMSRGAVANKLGLLRLVKTDADIARFEKKLKLFNWNSWH